MDDRGSTAGTRRFEAATESVSGTIEPSFRH
jgi:hypothetical protein